MTRDPIAPRKVNAKIPVDLETICLKAMEKDPARRYATAGTLAADLHQFLAHELIAAKRASPLRRMVRAVQRHPVIAISAVAVLLLAVVGGMAWQSSRRAGFERLLTEAQLALNSGDNHAALALADRVIGAAPDFPGARLARARALLGMYGRKQEAIDEANALIAADPEGWTGHAILVAAASGGFYSKPLEPHVEAVERLAPETAEAYTLRAIISDSSLEALELLDQALRIDPGYAQALLARADRHLSRQNPNAALEDADRLLAARPRSSLGRFMRTECFRSLHDREAALEEIDEAIRLAPAAGYYALRSEMRQEAQETEGAREDIERAIELLPESRKLHLQKAWLELAAGKLDDALEAARKSLALDPSNPDAYSALRDIHDARGEVDEIQRILDELDRIAGETTDPDWLSRLRSRRARMLRDQGDLDAAIAEADAAVAATPDDPFNYTLRAELKQARDGSEASEEDCLLAAALPLDEPPDLFQRAVELNSDCHMEELALVDLNRLLEINSDSPRPLALRGWIHSTANRYEEALLDFEKAVAMAPQWSDSWLRMGGTLHFLERHEEAVEAFEQAITLKGSTDGHETYWANSLIALGRDDQAVGVADALIQRLPDRGSSHRFRSDVLVGVGRLTEAVESINKAIELVFQFASFQPVPACLSRANVMVFGRGHASCSGGNAG